MSIPRNHDKTPVTCKSPNGVSPWLPKTASELIFDIAVLVFCWLIVPEYGSIPHLQHVSILHSNTPHLIEKIGFKGRKWAWQGFFIGVPAPLYVIVYHQVMRWPIQALLNFFWLHSHISCQFFWHFCWNLFGTFVEKFLFFFTFVENVFSSLEPKSLCALIHFLMSNETLCNFEHRVSQSFAQTRSFFWAPIDHISSFISQRLPSHRKVSTRWTMCTPGGYDKHRSASSLLHNPIQLEDFEIRALIKFA